MLISLILSNSLFLGLGILILLPQFHAARFLRWKKGMPFLLLSGFVILRSFFPWELPFTTTLHSRTILPVLYRIPDFELWKGIAVIDLMFFGWALTSVFFIARMALQYRKIRDILDCVSETDDKDLLRMAEHLNRRKTRPKILEVDAGIGPFLLGWKDPILVLPPDLSEEEKRFSLLHEMMHHNHSHMLIKMSAELLLAVYFWNPIIRIFRRFLLQGVELQTDSYVKEYLAEEECCQYAQTLLQNVRRAESPAHAAVCLSFFPRENILKKRVLCILSETKETIKEKAARGIRLFLTLICLLTSVFLTIEVSYPIPPEILEEGFLITRDNAYFQWNPSEKAYVLFVDGERMVSYAEIPEFFFKLPVYRHQ